MFLTLCESFLNRGFFSDFAFDDNSQSCFLTKDKKAFTYPLEQAMQKID